MKNNEIPSWLCNSLDEEAFKSIEKSVEIAELKTSGEIVPIIVRRSSTIGHVPILIFFILIIASAFFDLRVLTDKIIPYNLHGYGIEFIIGIPLLAYIANFLGRISLLQRISTPPEDQNQQVEMRAQLEFYQANLENTRDGTGIMIFVSMMEHRVTVLADKAIADKLPGDTWNEVVQLILNGKKKKDLASGLEAGIKKCGELLAKDFPIQPEDTNELKNHLIIKD